jgi:predicted ester cyclase
VIEERDRLVSRISLTGRHEGDFLGVPVMDREVELAATTILACADGPAVERWSSSDTLGLLARLGTVPPPGPAS